MFVCCVLSGKGLCDELITRPEESSSPPQDNSLILFIVTKGTLLLLLLLLFSLALQPSAGYDLVHEVS
jgi:hypothetical protein